MQQQRILVGFGSSLSAVEVVWSLLDSGYAVTVYVRKGVKVPVSKYLDVETVEITSPQEDVKQAISDLEDHLKTGSYSAIMPLEDDSVWMCNKLSGSVDTGVIGPTGYLAELALNKNLQISAAVKAGINVVDTNNIQTKEEILSLRYLPLILKPENAIIEHDAKLSKGKFYACADYGEIKSAADSWSGVSGLLAQPFIDGTGEGLFGIATKDGVKGWSAHQRVRMMNPAGSGSSACKNIPVDPVLSGQIEDMLMTAGWRGLFMVEMMRERSGKVWFVELNGRPWGSMALARRAGFEYPAWAVKLFFDENFVPPAVETGKEIICRHLGREILHLLLVLRGSKSKAFKRWPSRTKALFDVVRIGSNDRWYNYQPGFKRLFLCDTWQTIEKQVFKRDKRY